MRREQSLQAERGSLRVRERCALVQALAVEKIHTAWQLSVSCHDRPPVSAAMRVVVKRCSTWGNFSTPEVRPGQVDDLVAAAAENRPDHEDAEPGRLVEVDRRRHGELPP